MKDGEVAEWFKAAVSKTAVLCIQDRGFESHPLRQIGNEGVGASSMSDNIVFFKGSERSLE